MVGLKRRRLSNLWRRQLGPGQVISVSLHEATARALELLAEVEGCSKSHWLERRILAAVNAVQRSGYFQPEEMRMWLEALFGKGVSVGAFLTRAAAPLIDANCAGAEAEFGAQITSTLAELAASAEEELLDEEDQSPDTAEPPPDGERHD